MRIREEAREKIRKNIIKIHQETGRSITTIEGWVYQRPHILKKEWILKKIKKITGLREDQIFED